MPLIYYKIYLFFGELKDDLTSLMNRIAFKNLCIFFPILKVTILYVLGIHLYDDKYV